MYAGYGVAVHVMRDGRRCCHGHGQRQVYRVNKSTPTGLNAAAAVLLQRAQLKTAHARPLLIDGVVRRPPDSMTTPCKQGTCEPFH